jgi:hypothetical protein
LNLGTCSYSAFRSTMGEPIRTSLGSPKFKLAYELRESMWSLTPRPKYLRSPFEEYRAEYVTQLERHGVASLSEQFEKVQAKTGAETLVVLCFEQLVRPGEWCHRRLFAEWWLGKTGQPVPELSKVPPTRDLWSAGDAQTWENPQLFLF